MANMLLLEVSSMVKCCTVYDIYAIPAVCRPDIENSLYGETLDKIWLRKHITGMCHTKCCEDAELILCSSRDGVSLK